MERKPKLPHLQELEALQQEQTPKNKKKPSGSKFKGYATFVLGLALGFALLFFLVPSLLRSSGHSKYDPVLGHMMKLIQSTLDDYKSRRTDYKDWSFQTFLCEGRGWICLPLQKPCHAGRPLYTSSEMRINHSCWQKMGFNLNKESYFQYCYRADGRGKKATFTLQAHADLDCDGVQQTYRIKGSIDPKDGLPTATYPEMINQLE